MDVPITKPIDIHPVSIGSAPWAGTEIQEYRLLAVGKKIANSSFLRRDRIPESKSKKVDVPARYREKTVTKKE